MSNSDNQQSMVSSVRRVAAHWRPAMLAFVVMFGFIASVALILPNQYQSRVKILVKNARVNPMVSLDQQTQGVLYVDEVSEARINTEIELITSADVLQQVVTRCHLEDFVKPSVRDMAEREGLELRQLQKDLTVSAVRKSDIIEVAYRSPDARRSATVVAALADVYLQAHLKLHGSPGSSKFFQELSATYAAELAATEAELAQFRQTHHIVALPEEKSLALQQSTELEKSLAASTAQARREEAAADHLERAVGSLSPMIEKERRSLPNQNSSEQLSVLLLGYKNKRTEALQRYMPEDRIVKELDAQITQTEDALATARQGDAQEITSGSNPTLLSAQDQYVHSSADAHADIAQSQELSRELGTNRARLMALDRATVPYEQLERRTKQLQELADFYKKKGDEAQVNDLLDNQRISNVTIAEHPLQAEAASSPKRGLILSLGFLWSLLLAAGTAFLADLLNERVFTPYELEQVPGLPLLASLPSLALAPSFNGAFPAVYLSMKRLEDDAVRSQP